MLVTANVHRPTQYLFSLSRSLACRILIDRQPTYDDQPVPHTLLSITYYTIRITAVWTSNLSKAHETRENL